MPAQPKASAPAASPRSVTSISAVNGRKAKARPGSGSSVRSGRAKRQPFALRTAELAFEDANLMRTRRATPLAPP